MEKRSFLYGFGAGFIVLFIIAAIPIVESAIPPTRAFPFINITVDWFSPDPVRVESLSSSDTWTLISDGSIYFNVTESP